MSSKAKSTGALLVCLVISTAMGCGNSETDETTADDAGITTEGGTLNHVGEFTVGLSSRGPGQVLVKTYEDTLGVQLAQGYNSVKDQPNQLVCITYDAPQAFDGGFINSAGHVTTTTNYYMTESKSDLASKMNISAGASVKYGMYGVSASGEADAELAESSNTVYAYVYVNVQGPAVSLTNVALKDSYKDLADVKEVYEDCGDYYAGAITSGGTLHAVLQFSASDHSKVAGMKSEISASMASLGKISASSAASLKDTASKYSATVKSFATGCNAYQVGTDVDSFVTAAQTFVDDINTCLDQKTVQNIMNMASTVTYFKMDEMVKAAYGSTETEEALLAGRNNLDKIVDNILAFETFDNDAQTIRDNQDLFDFSGTGTYTIDDLIGLQNDINKSVADGGYVAVLNQALDVCSNLTFQCEYPTTPTIPDTGDLRARLPTLKVQQQQYFETCEEFESVGLEVDRTSQTIYVNRDQNKPLTVWCEDNQAGNMSTYLDLSHNNLITNTSSPSFEKQSPNWSGFMGYWQYHSHGKSVYWPDSITIYRKVRILPYDSLSVSVDICDSKFASSARNPTADTRSFPLGGVFGCAENDLYHAPYGAMVAGVRGSKAPRHRAHGFVFENAIDLSGTPFSISEDMVWVASGTHASGYGEVMNADRTTFDMQVKGDNGYLRPYLGLGGPVGLKLDYVGLGE